MQQQATAPIAVEQLSSLLFHIRGIPGDSEPASGVRVWSANGNLNAMVLDGRRIATRTIKYDGGDLNFAVEFHRLFPWLSRIEEDEDRVPLDIVVEEEQVYFNAGGTELILPLMTKFPDYRALSLPIGDITVSPSGLAQAVDSCLSEMKDGTIGGLDFDGDRIVVWAKDTYEYKVEADTESTDERLSLVDFAQLKPLLDTFVKCRKNEVQIAIDAQIQGLKILTLHRPDMGLTMGLMHHKPQEPKSVEPEPELEVAEVEEIAESEPAPVIHSKPDSEWVLNVEKAVIYQQDLMLALNMAASHGMCDERLLTELFCLRSELPKTKQKAPKASKPKQPKPLTPVKAPKPSKAPGEPKPVKPKAPVKAKDLLEQNKADKELYGGIVAIVEEHGATASVDILVGMGHEYRGNTTLSQIKTTWNKVYKASDVITKAFDDGLISWAWMYKRSRKIDIKEIEKEIKALNKE